MMAPPPTGSVGRGVSSGSPSSSACATGCSSQASPPRVLRRREWRGTAVGSERVYHAAGPPRNNGRGSRPWGTVLGGKPGPGGVLSPLFAHRSGHLMGLGASRGVVWCHSSSSTEPKVSADPPGELIISFDSMSDDEATLLSIEGPNIENLLLAVTGVLSTLGMKVLDATISTDEAFVRDIFRISDLDGLHLSQERESLLRARLVSTLTGNRSVRPAIYGVAASVEAEILTQQGRSSSVGEGSALQLEIAAAEMATAAAGLVALERELSDMKSADIEGIAENAILEKEVLRQEAAAVLERRMAAMEAVLAARKNVLLPEGGAVTPSYTPTFSRGGGAEGRFPLGGGTSTGPAAGRGYEIMLQAFNWESCKTGNHYKVLKSQAEDWLQAGFTAVWLPPPTDSVSQQGYLPRDLYDLNSAYGSEEDLRDLLTTLKDKGLKPLADVVINHRCAHYQDEEGRWNKYGGRLEWPRTAITSNNHVFGGEGNRKSLEDYTAAPNIDHSQEFVQKDLSAWLKFLKNIGFQGWRFDFVKGYAGEYTRMYIDETVPAMAVGEFWDSCSYTDGVLNYNQDAHRQRTVDWCDTTGGTSAAFDFTTKGILQEALSKSELWRLIDSQGRMPGLTGLWPSRSVTFLENHDTGSTLNHWPFPHHHLSQGYAYILTHPGTPCVFYDHYYTEGELGENIRDLIKLRTENGIHARSPLKILETKANIYAACIDEKICVKLGNGDWSPNWEGGVLSETWSLALTGNDFAVWEKEYES